MWNFMNAMGHPGHPASPFAQQKREFSLHVSNVPIVSGKAFSNPNFVNKHHPSVHSYQNNFILTPMKKITSVDSSNVNSLLNSSQSIVDTLKQNNLDLVRSVPEEAQMCNGRKRGKRSRRSRRRRSPGKNSKQHNSCQLISDMMEVDVELTPEAVTSDASMSPRMPCFTFNLTDFIVQKKPKECRHRCESDEEDLVAVVVTPPKDSRMRQVSVTESEDSFIVFDSGTDDELAFSDESDQATESEDDEEDEDEVDSASSVIPHKKVRFAGASELCEVHPMVKWSYAYQQARKGPWEEYARDRDRFNRRILDTEKILSPIFAARHRDNVYEERFRDNPISL